jgi:hypothetical protein
LSLGLVFWILMLIWLVFGLVWNWPNSPGATALAPYGPIGNTILLFVLFLLLGWHAWGPPIHQ